MQRIVVATDFSERSVLAVQRAAQLAKQFSATLDVVHVVDADLPPRMIEAALEAASESLDELASTLQNKQGVNCTREAVCASEAFVGVLDAAQKSSADLIVIGAHRRRILRDIFIGTTAERIVRTSKIPVLMVNAQANGAYRSVLIAVDLSDASKDAVRAAQSLGLPGVAQCAVLHAFPSPVVGLLVQTGAEIATTEDYLLKEQTRARSHLKTLLDELQLGALEQHVVPMQEEPATTIRDFARAHGVELIVAATHGRGGLAKVLLGSVAQDLLRSADQDVLIAPVTRS